MSTILTWVKRDLNEFPSENRDKIQKEELTLDLSGHKSHGRNDYENIKWIRKSLSVGDEVKIKIVESEKYDEPIEKKRSDPDFVEKQKRKHFDKLKQEYKE